ncbi:MAG: M23 family metallopeptidase [Candidatus Moranbacteria bacterium]|nr:M23 family metallopeptidase [Candidatus Moranbacteria bacterium]
MDHSVFDHTPVQFYQTDDIVEAFNGQIGDKQYGSRLTDGVWGYLMNIGEDDFLAGYNYTEPKEYLFYDGHPGYDFAVPAGTDVLAPADGKLYWAMSDPVNGDVSGFGTFYIDHGNGNTTWFLHCSGLTQDVLDEIQQNGYATVYQGDHIAESSNKGTSGYHLHFEVRLNGIDDANVIDPYKEDMWE